MHRLISAAVAVIAAAGLATAQVDCEQGCSPGYWGQHPESWDGVPEDFTSSIVHQIGFNAIFGVTPAESGHADTVTLLDACNTGGGGLMALARHAAAGLPSAESLPCYPYSVPQVIAIYRDAIGVDPGPLEIAGALSDLANFNTIGCPYPNRYWKYCFGEAGACPCGNTSLSGGCANSTGNGTLLDVVAGTTSVVADDLVLQASNLPANAFTILIGAQAHRAVPFSDGNLCIGGSQTKIVRYSAPTAAPPSGVLSWGPGLVALSNSNSIGLPAIVGIDAGETWYYQAYYRDAGGPCLTNSNTSNAIAVTFH